MSRPRVSVVIPNFNYAPFLSEAIESVLLQSFQDFEVIVVDNFSSDGSDRVAKSFRDPRIRFVSFANMGSIARARNKGVELANGEYIAFLDSDDKWYPRKLELQLASTHKNVVSYHPLRFFGAKKWGKTSAWKVSKPALQHLLSGGNPVSTSSVMVSRDLLIRAGSFPEDPAFFAVEDYCLWLALAEIGADFDLIPQVLGSYRIHVSASAKVDGAAGILRFVEAKFEPLDARTKAQFNGFLSYMRSLYLHKNEKKSEFRASLFEALLRARWRFRWRAALRLMLSLVTFGQKT